MFQRAGVHTTAREHSDVGERDIFEALPQRALRCDGFGTAEPSHNENSAYSASFSEDRLYAATSIPRTAP